MGDQEMTRAEEVAKRANELAARAEELARHAHEVAGVDEQLAALEAELEALVAEEESLDGGAGDVDGDLGGPASDLGGDFGSPAGDDFGGGAGDHRADGFAHGGRAGDRQAGDHRPGDDWVGWTGAFGDRMEALGERIGDLISGSLEAAFHSSPENPSAFGGGRRYQYNENEKVLTVAGPVALTVASDGGSVNVRPGPSDRVTVSWRGRGLASGLGDQDAVTVAETDGTVHIESTGGRGWRSRVVQVDVEVPVHSPVDVTTGGGSLRIEGTQAAVRARTGGGPIHIADVDGELSATTGGGSVRVDGRLRGHSNIRTGGGAVSVVLSRDTRIDLDAQGTSASIDVPGLKVHGFHVSGTVGGGGDGALEVRTGGGSARITQA